VPPTPSIAPTATPRLDMADLAISIDDGTTTAVPGQILRYTMIARNNGPGDVHGAMVRNRFPRTIGRIVNWRCSASAGSWCTADSTYLVIRDTVHIAAGGTLTYNVEAWIRRPSDGLLRNTVDIRPPEGMLDPDLSNNIATDVTEIRRRR
jgi:uncharacterized repeat protein (TIGR01451 family)